METISRLKDDFFALVSPAKKRPRFEEPSGRHHVRLYSNGQANSLEAVLPDVHRVSMSPRSKTREWLNQDSRTSTTSGMSSRSKKASQRPPMSSIPRVRSGGIRKAQTATKKRFSLPGLSWFISQPIDEEKDTRDANDTTLVAIEEEEERESPSKSFLSPTTTAVESNAEPESEISPAQRAELNLRKAFDSSDWTQPEITIFRCLSMRGHEPLLPRHWAMDYPTFPSALFNRNYRDSLLGSLPGNDFRAQRAFNELIALGCTVRSSIEARIRPEHKIKNAIQRYQKWAAWDGQYAKREHLPLFVIVEPREAGSTAALGELLTGKLRSLAERWREAYRIRPSVENSSIRQEEEEYMAPLPALMGVLLKGSIAGVVTYHAQGLTSQKSVAVFDFSSVDQDVWNALGVAMLVLHSRDWLAGCLERGEMEAEIVEDIDDVDA